MSWHEAKSQPMICWKFNINLSLLKIAQLRSKNKRTLAYVVMGALVCKLSDLETPQLKIYLPICKERSSGLSATAVWWRRYWRQPGGGGVAAALAWRRRQCGGGSTYDVLHWAEEVRVRVLPIPAQGSDPCITCVPLNMTCGQKKKSRILIY